MPDLREIVPSEMNPPLNPVLVQNNAGLADLHDFCRDTPEFSWDLETNVVPTFANRKIRTMQIGNREKQFVVDLLCLAGSTSNLVQQGCRTPPRWATPLLEATAPWLASKDHVKVGWNMSFEYVTTLWNLGLRTWNFWDGMEVERQFYQGKVKFYAKDFWGLENAVARYTGLKMGKEEQTSFDLETPLTDRQIIYGALDVRLPLAVKVGQMRNVEKLQLHRVVALENHAVPAFSEMHINGKKLSEERWIALVESIEADHKRNVKALDTFFIPVVGTKESTFEWSDAYLASLEADWRDEKDRVKRAEHLAAFRAARRERKAWEKACEKCEGEAYINYSAHDQLLQAMRKLGFGEKKLPNTSAKLMAKFSDKPVVQAVQAFRKSDKALTTYGREWLKYIDPDTGRVHARHQQNGTETGRPSCTAPNLYNIPKDKRYRSCFVARPGYKIITVDESGAELRIIAELSGEESWIAAFSHNWDMHSVIAEQMQKEKWTAAKGVNCQFEHDRQKCSCPAHKVMRDGAKAVNFGVAYGKEVYALAEDLKIPVELASEILAAWRKANSKVQKFLTDSGNFAKQNNHCRTMSGRIRFFLAPDWKTAEARSKEDAEKFGRKWTPNDVGRKYGAMLGSIEREGKNTPIQGSNADITKTAMGAGSDKDGVEFMWHKLREFDYVVPDGAQLDVETVTRVLPDGTEQRVKEAWLINHVYDEVVVEAPDETADDCKEMLGGCFGRGGAEFMKRVFMDYEGHVEECWTK